MPDAEIALAPHRDYKSLLTGIVDHACRRITVSMFIVEVTMHDPTLAVLDVLHECAAARDHHALVDRTRCARPLRQVLRG